MNKKNQLNRTKVDRFRGGALLAALLLLSMTILGPAVALPALAAQTAAAPTADTAPENRTNSVNEEMLAAAAVQETGTTQEFIPSTPEMQHQTFSWDEEKRSLAEALDKLYNAGISPMAIVDKIFGDKDNTSAQNQNNDTLPAEDTAAGEPTEPGAAVTPSSETDANSGLLSQLQSTAQNAGDSAVSAAQEAGDKLVDSATAQAEQTKQSIFDSLKQTLKDAANNLVDALFSKL